MRDGLVRVVRTALPGPGALGDQDGRDMEALTLMRGVYTRALQEVVARRRREDDTREWRQDREQRIRRGEL